MFDSISKLDVWNALTILYVCNASVIVVVVAFGTFRRFLLRTVLRATSSKPDVYGLASPKTEYLVGAFELYTYDRRAALLDVRHKLESGKVKDLPYLSEAKRIQIENAYLSHVHVVAKAYDKVAFHDLLPDRLLRKLLSSAAKEYFSDFSEDYQRLLSRFGKTGAV